jgi:hypothetical protein
MLLNCGKAPIMLLIFSDQSPEEIDMKDAIDGPFLQIAVFCEKVLQEKDGVISAIRIVDRMTIAASGEGAPEKMPPIDIAIVMLVRFKSGSASGKYELKVKPISPSGKELATTTLPFMLGGGELAANIVLNYTIKAEEAGLFWFDIMLNDKSFTKISLNVIYERKPEVSTSSSSGN